MKECRYEKKFPLQADKNVIRCGYTGYCEIKGDTCCDDCPLYRPRMIFRLKRMWKRLWK